MVDKNLYVCYLSVYFYALKRMKYEVFEELSRYYPNVCLKIMNNDQHYELVVILLFTSELGLCAFNTIVDHKYIVYVYIYTH